MSPKEKVHASFCKNVLLTLGVLIISLFDASGQYSFSLTTSPSSGAAIGIDGTSASLPPTFGWQWEVSSTGMSSSWSNLVSTNASGSTGSSYTDVDLSSTEVTSGNYYRLSITDGATSTTYYDSDYTNGTQYSSTPTTSYSFSLTTSPSSGAAIGIDNMTASLPSYFSYQWYESSTGSTYTAIANPSAYGSASTPSMADLSSSLVTSGYYYYLKITYNSVDYYDNNYPSGTQYSSTPTTSYSFSLTTSPSSGAAIGIDNMTASLPSYFSYQWYESSTGSTYTAIANPSAYGSASTPSMADLSSSLVTSGYYYYLKITYNSVDYYDNNYPSGTQYSSTPTTSYSFSLTTSPSSGAAIGIDNMTASLPSYFSYQWYESSTGSTYTAIANPSAYGSASTPSMADLSSSLVTSGYYYYLKITYNSVDYYDNNYPSGTLYSSTPTTSYSFSLTTSPSSGAAIGIDNMTASLPSYFSYQWYESSTGSTYTAIANPSAYGSASTPSMADLSSSLVTSGYYYYLKITYNSVDYYDNNYPSGTQYSSTPTTSYSFSLTTSPSSGAAIGIDNMTASLPSYFSYQWYESSTGSTYTAIANPSAYGSASTPSMADLSSSLVTSGYYYYLKITYNSVDYYDNNYPSGTQYSSTPTTSYSFSLTTSPSSGAAIGIDNMTASLPSYFSYQWYESSTGSTYTAIANPSAYGSASTPSMADLSSSLVTSGYYYYLKITYNSVDYYDNNYPSGTLYSSTPTTSYSFSLTTSPSSGAAIGIDGTSASLPTTFSWQWYESSDDISYSPLTTGSGTGATSASDADLLSTSATNGYYYYLEINDGTGTYEDDTYSTYGTGTQYSSTSTTPSFSLTTSPSSGAALGIDNSTSSNLPSIFDWQWYVSTSMGGTFSQATGASGTGAMTESDADLDATYATSGYFYYLEITDNSGNTYYDSDYTNGTEYSSTPTTSYSFSLTTSPSSGAAIGIDGTSASLPTTFSWQWYESSDDISYSPLTTGSGTGATSASDADLLSTSATNGYYYYLEINDGTGTYEDDTYSTYGTGTQYSSTSTTPSFSLTTSPTTSGAALGIDNSTSSNLPSIFDWQWYVSTSMGGTFSQATGASGTGAMTESDADLDATYATSGYFYYLEITDNSGNTYFDSDYTNGTQYSSTPTNSYSFSLTTSPSSGAAIGIDGTSASLPTTFSWQWYESSDDISYSPLTTGSGTGATSASDADLLSTSATNGYYYYLEINDGTGTYEDDTYSTYGTGTQYSSTSTTPSFSLTTSPSSGAALGIDNSTSSNLPSIFDWQWYVSTSMGGTFSQATGASGTGAMTESDADLDATYATSGYFYYLEITDNSGNTYFDSDYTNGTQYSSTPTNSYSFSLTTSPSSGAAIGIDGTSASLPTTFSWQWYESSDNSTFTMLTGAAGTGGSSAADADLSSSLLTNGYYYYLEIENGIDVYENDRYTNYGIGVRFIENCAGIPSNGSTTSSSSSGSSGSTIELDVSGVLALNLDYQWQSSTDNINYSDILNATDSNYSATIGNTTIYYRRKTTCTNSNQYSYSWSKGISPSTTLGGNSSSTTLYTYDGTSWSPSTSTPTSTDQVVFTGDYTISGNDSYGHVTISGSTLTISPNASLTVNGNLFVSSGSTLLSESSAAGYSQLLVTGQIRNEGTITQQSTLKGNGAVGISSSMKEGFETSADITTSVLYLYDATTGSYASPSDLTAPGVGYYGMVGSGGVMSSTGTFSVSGNPVTNYTHSLGYTSNQATGGSGDGWNLLGNPYTTMLDWSSVTKTDVNDAIYIWDRAGGKYKYHVNGVSAPSGSYISNALSSSLIPPMHAFWVQATSSSATVVSTMADDGTVSTSPGHFNKNRPDNIILSVQEYNDSTNVDATWVINNTNSTIGFDGHSDAWKMYNYQGHNVFSLVGEEDFAINAMDLSDSVALPIGITDLEVGTPYVLKIDQLINDQPYQIWLEDRFYNAKTAIAPEGYTFVQEPYYGKDTRFVMHIYQADFANSVNVEQYDNQNMTIYSDGTQIHILGDLQQYHSYRIISANGQTIAEGKVKDDLRLNNPKAAGIYIVQLVGANHAHSQKISITK